MKRLYYGKGGWLETDIDKRRADKFIFDAALLEWGEA